MKIMILRLIAVFAIVSMACSFNVNLPSANLIETQSVTIDEAAPENGSARVEIRMGGGTLELSGGSSALVSGTIEYNVEGWEPRVERSGDSVRIRQSFRNAPLPNRRDEIINHWDLQLGDTPVDLDIEAGAYNGTLDLSGIPITRLEINSGASSSEVRFDSPNPESMSSLTYQTGASNVSLTGLSNANFSTMDFTGAAGDYTLDFSGEIQQEATVNIQGAVGDVELIVPAGRPVNVELTGGLSDIDIQGDWQRNGNDNYTTSGSGPVLNINIEMSIGTIKLISQ